MINNNMSRQHLESLSTADLLSIADQYGIEIPDDLNRRFIIGELLEAAQEYNKQIPEDDEELTENPEAVKDSLPKSYNHTKINAILRNPAWAFVFWDIREQDMIMFQKKNIDTLNLRVLFFDSELSDRPSDSFTLSVNVDEREQYVLIPAGKRFFSVNLEYSDNGILETADNDDEVHETVNILSYTKRVEIPAECKAITDIQPGRKIDMEPLIKLSGMEKLLREQFINHRQSFS